MERLTQQDEMKKILNRITDGFIVLDKNFNYTFVNDRIGQMVGRDPDSLIGKNVWDEFPDAVDSATYKAFETAMKEQRFISIVDYFEPLDLWQENYIYPSLEGLSVFIKDITASKKLEKQLRETEKNQQFELLVTSLEAQEKERTEIGRELHDNVNQLLVATRLMLSHVMNNKDQLDEVLPLCLDNLDKAVQENRKISHELVSPDFDAGSLRDQLAFLLHSMFEHKDISTEFSYLIDEKLLNGRMKLALYRIAQEQCLNIIKHAGASKVEITVQANEEALTMKIYDNGKGFDRIMASKGIGLRNIEARIKMFDGSMNVDSSPGKGFKLEVSLPIKSSL